MCNAIKGPSAQVQRFSRQRMDPPMDYPRMPGPSSSLNAYQFSTGHQAVQGYNTNHSFHGAAKAAMAAKVFTGQREVFIHVALHYFNRDGVKGTKLIHVSQFTLRCHSSSC